MVGGVKFVFCINRDYLHWATADMGNLLIKNKHTGAWNTFFVGHVWMFKHQWRKKIEGGPRPNASMWMVRDHTTVFVKITAITTETVSSSDWSWCWTTDSWIWTCLQTSVVSNAKRETLWHFWCALWLFQSLFTPFLSSSGILTYKQCVWGCLWHDSHILADVT